MRMLLFLECFQDHSGFTTELPPSPLGHERTQAAIVLRIGVFKKRQIRGTRSVGLPSLRREQTQSLPPSREGLALASARVLRSLLYEVGTLDPTIYVAVASVLILVAGCASYLPAYRATRVDPLTSMRAV